MSEGIPDFLNLKVITPRQLWVDRRVTELSLPGLEGELGILPGHRPHLVVLGEGSLSCKWTGGEDRVGVAGGYAEIRGDSVQVFTRLKGDDEYKSDSFKG